MSIQGVLFDVDGTLVDTNYLHTLAWSRALIDAGEWAPMNAIHRLIGMGSDQLVDRLLGHPSPAAMEARKVRYDELIDEAHPFPRASDLLRDLRRRGMAVVLATSAAKNEFEQLLRLLDVEDVVTASTTADDVESAKPAPDIVEAALEAGGLQPADVVFVGDSVWDIEACQRAGVRCLAVESGGFGADELRSAGAERVYRDVAEMFDELPGGPLGDLSRRAGSDAPDVR
jgi:HAD superfamily hydrolase (TIGR01509 family)